VHLAGLQTQIGNLKMNTATDIMTDTAQWVCVRWDIFGGYYYVGPFAAAHEAGDWAVKNEGTNICWQTERLDPNVALEVRSPGEMPDLEPDPAEPDRWVERQAEDGDFYLLMDRAADLVSGFREVLLGPISEPRTISARTATKVQRATL
jgi:hypothetical protein